MPRLLVAILLLPLAARAGDGADAPTDIAPASLHFGAGSPHSILVDDVEVAVVAGVVEIAPGAHRLGGLCPPTEPIVRYAEDGRIVYARSAVSSTSDDVLKAGIDYDVSCIEWKLNGQIVLMPDVVARQ